LFALAFPRSRSTTTSGLISAGSLNHLLTDLSLKVLGLTADLIQLGEERLEFFRRYTGHSGFYSRAM